MNINTEHDLVFIFSQLSVNNNNQTPNRSVKRKDIHKNSLRKAHNAPHSRSKRRTSDTALLTIRTMLQKNTNVQNDTANRKRKNIDIVIKKESKTPCSSPKRRTSEKLTSVAKNRLPNQKQTAYFSPYNMNQN